MLSLGLVSVVVYLVSHGSLNHRLSMAASRMPLHVTAYAHVPSGFDGDLTSCATLCLPSNRSMSLLVADCAHESPASTRDGRLSQKCSNKGRQQHVLQQSNMS